MYCLLHNSNDANGILLPLMWYVLVLQARFYNGYSHIADSNSHLNPQISLRRLMTVLWVCILPLGVNYVYMCDRERKRLASSQNWYTVAGHHCTDVCRYTGILLVASHFGLEELDPIRGVNVLPEHISYVEQEGLSELRNGCTIEVAVILRANIMHNSSDTQQPGPVTTYCTRALWQSD